MVLVFYALSRELGGVRKRIENRSALSDGLRGFRGRLAGEEIVLVATGIGIAHGRESARRAFQRLAQPRMVISTGVAGGLAPELKTGDLILADRMLMESGEAGSYEQVARIASDTMQAVQNRLNSAGMTAAVGPMLTARRVLSRAADKREAHAGSGGIAVDMESAAIALEAAKCAAPFVCIRSIIDEAADEIPGAELADEAGHVSPLAAAAYFMRNPSVVTWIPAILRNLNRATASIGAALEVLCRDTPAEC
jgi:nucleoside phosphorylase